MGQMKEPINFDKIENYILIDFNQKGMPRYKIERVERVGPGGRKFWITPEAAQSNGLQFVIYWQSNPMVDYVDTVEVELYKNGPGMVRGGMKRYNVTRSNILSVDDFYDWVKTVIKDFEPELSTVI